MEVVCLTDTLIANPSSELTESLLSEASDSARTFSTEPSVNLQSVHSQNGQYIIHQPLKTVNNGQAFFSNRGALSKGHIIVRHKPLSTYQQTPLSSATACLGDNVTVETAGIKRPLTSSDNNVITKVFISKNALSGQTQAFSVGSSSQAFALASLSSGGNIKIRSSGSKQQACSSVTQPAALTKTLTLTSQGILTPMKTAIANISSIDTSKTSVPSFTMSTFPSKSSIKTVMIPASGSPNKQSLSSNMTMLSRPLNAISQTAGIPIRPGSASTMNIKQGFTSPSLSSFTLRGQSLQTLAPQPASTVMSSNVAQSVRAQQTTQKLQPVTAGSTGQVQQIQVPGSQFHYVQLVSPCSSTDTTASAVLNTREVTQVVQAPTNIVAPASNTSQIKIALPLQQKNVSLAPKPTTIPVSVQQGVHHIILPATSSSVSVQSNAVTTLVPIQPGPSVPVAAVHNVNQLPSGTTILSTANSNIQGLQSFALVPASYVTQLQQQVNKSQEVTQATTGQSVPKQSIDFVPIASIDPAITQYTVSRNVPNHDGPTLEATGARPRKPCNCTKSQCLKLYCDCFANGEFCQNCNCNNCANNLEHEEERSKAIKSCLDRNPQAFHPKIGKSKQVEGSRQHNKGCNCKRSGCLKNYCECYEAKITCTNFCKCFGCKNFEESAERKTLMHLADAAEVRVQQQTAAKTKLSSQISSVPARPPAATASGERLPFALVTADVAEATSACLLAQAEEAERMKMPPVVQERMIIEEFGRCLMQIIDSANRTRGH